MPCNLKSLIASCVALTLTACVAEVTPPRARIVVPAPEVYVPAPPRAVVSVYVEPPISEPAPIAIGWAPPPLLVESPPPSPFDGAVWVGGYWVWQGDWVWAHGHWVSPPRPQYLWVNPYYEHRDGVVIFITGHWAPPGVAFVPPPPGIHLTVEVAAAGVIAGPRPLGPNGCFVPAPPGSRPGIIVPAPIGTAPAVVTGAPPVVAVGMRVTANVNNTTVIHNNTVVNNTTNNITNVRNVTNVTNVTIVAPPSATANGQAVNASVPAQAHLAAAQPAVFKATAPEPASTKPIPAFVHGKPPAPLPPAQPVHAVSTGPLQAHTNPQRQENEPHTPQVRRETPAQHSNSPAAPGGSPRTGTPVSAAPGKSHDSAVRPAAAMATTRNHSDHPPSAGADAHPDSADRPVAANPKPNHSGHPSGQPPGDPRQGGHNPEARSKPDPKAHAKGDHAKKPPEKPKQREPEHPGA